MLVQSAENTHVDFKHQSSCARYEPEHLRRMFAWSIIFHAKEINKNRSGTQACRKEQCIRAADQLGHLRDAWNGLPTSSRKESHVITCTSSYDLNQSKITTLTRRLTYSSSIHCKCTPCSAESKSRQSIRPIERAHWMQAEGNDQSRLIYCSSIPNLLKGNHGTGDPLQVHQSGQRKFTE